MLLAVAAFLTAQASSYPATDAYITCISSNAHAFAQDRDIAQPIEASLTQCEVFLAAAAADLRVMGGDAGLAKFRSDYRAAHGADPDMTVLLADMVRGAGRDLAERIITGRGYPNQPQKPGTTASKPYRPSK